jgi:D-xylulose reductase
VPDPASNTNTSPSIFLHGPHSVHLAHLPLPTITRPTDAIIRIRDVGVCWSDVHVWSHGGMGDKRVSATSPLVMGHEVSGTVHALEEGVTHRKVGDAVAIEPGSGAGPA